MTERKEIQLPPSWCGAICKNAMNEICVESCAVNRDCSGFDPKPDIDLANLPRFPLEETQDMSKEEKFTVVTVYLSAITDYLKGETNVRTPIATSRPKPIRRSIYVREASGAIYDVLTTTNLQAGEGGKAHCIPSDPKENSSGEEDC